MNKLKKELEVLKSWGIESISVDKVLSMIDEVEVNEDVITGEDRVGTFYPPCKEESEVEAFFKGITSITIDVHPVGGTIFYIDDTADGEYQFFDVDGNLIEDVQVGDRPYAYNVVTPGVKDKYYVYHDEVYEILTWTYSKDTIVKELVGTSKDIGSGRVNTEKVSTKDDRSYVVADSGGSPTIWYKLDQVCLLNMGGCDDWFVPSKYEIEALRKAIKSEHITGGTIAGSSYDTSVFSSAFLWSSSECAVNSAWHWDYYNRGWDGNGKGAVDSVLFIRAF